jgi:hypothetical protein
MSEDSVGVQPRTSCANSMIGKMTADMANPIEATPIELSVKLRSLNRPSGMSGSLGPKASQAANRASSTTPAPSSRGIVTHSQIWPQPKRSPSWMPKTTANVPAAESATPSQSSRLDWGLRLGTRRHARTRATTPTGTLMRKIHSQPSVSRRTPPRIGPTSIATPAVAPHSDIATPRTSGANVRVTTVIVCGVIIEAPRPWTTRAAMSMPIVPDSAHHSDAPVNRASPIMYIDFGPTRSPRRPVTSRGTA